MAFLVEKIKGIRWEWLTSKLIIMTKWTKKIRLIESKLVDLETDFGKNEFKLFNQSSILNGFEGTTGHYGL